ncbi:MAG TPA: ABC transporter permease [Jatrophihabitans sp.]|nr:ABC transporter permease [Jatrophihabitans sp.]
MNATYLRYEVLRTLRNRQSYIFSLAFPVILFLVIGGSNKHASGFPVDISPITYYMVGMLGFGAMGAVLAGGARIAVDRATGWNRQLRLSPLRPGAYLATKIAVGYLTATLTIAAMYVAGISLGARASISHWIEMTLFILIGLVPFAAIGIWIGHLVRDDAMGPVMGGLMSLFALVGGSWYPVTGVLGSIGSWIPSYWIVQAGHIAVGGSSWPVKGWLVVLGWSAVFAVLATRAFLADTGRSR